MNISAGTIARTVVLALALTNQVLVSTGHGAIPFESDEVEEFVTLVFTIVASVVAGWKNNSFTKNAIEADQYLKDLKKGETND